MKTDWVKKELGEIAYLSGRIGWKGLTAKEYTQEGPLFLSVHSLNYGDYVDFRDAYHVSQERYDESPEIMLQEEDVLICKDGAGIGKVGIIGDLPKQTTINSSLLLIRANKKILPKYVYYCLLSPYFQKIVNSRLQGATTPHLYQRDIKTFPIFLPSLPEQKRIVAILDEAFEGIATATANAEKNLANARELFESYLNSVLEEKGEEWVATTIGNEVELLPGFAFKSAKYTDTGDAIKLLRGDNIVQGGLRWTGVKKWPSSDVSDYEKFWLSEGDVVLAMDRPWVNAGLKRAIIDASDLPCLLVQRVARLRCKSGVENRFLFYLVSSSQFTKYLLTGQTGIGVPHISGKQIQSFNFRLPSLERQREIVKNLDVMSEQTKRLEAIYRQKLSDFAELKQSILQKAFSGELTRLAA